MLWRDVIELITIETTQDDDGNVVESESSVTVFANEKSIRQSEFYQAASVGLNPQKMFEVRTAEIGNATRVRHNGSSTLRIVRMYSKNDEVTEIICSDSLKIIK